MSLDRGAVRAKRPKKGTPDADKSKKDWIEERASGRSAAPDFKTTALWFANKGPFLTDGYLEFEIGKAAHGKNRSKARTSRLNDPGLVDAEKRAIREEGLKKAEKVMLAGSKKALATIQADDLFGNFMVALHRQIKKYPDWDEGRRKLAMNVFVNKSGDEPPAYWNAPLEFDHRNAVHKKRGIGHIKEDDPELKKLGNFLDNGVEIPIDEFIVEESKIKDQRTARKTGNLDIVDVASYRTDMRTAPTWNNSRGLGTPDKPVPWKVFDRSLITHLKPVFKPFLEYKSYQEGEKKNVDDEYSTAARAYHQHRSGRTGRGPDPKRLNAPRDSPPRPNVSCLHLGVGASTKELLVHEEIMAIEGHWKQLGRVVHRCQIEHTNAVGVYYAVIEAMMDTEAMVCCCDVPYDRPSLLTFRNVIDDTMSYAPDEMKKAIKQRRLAAAEEDFVPASDAAPPCMRYTLPGGCQFHIRPYAARMSAGLQLTVNFDVMRRCHCDVYETVVHLIHRWRSGVAGQPPGERFPMLVERPPMINGRFLTDKRQWRYRRARFDEIGLPSSEFPFLAEFWWECEQIWVVHTHGLFFAEKIPRVWEALSCDETGAYRPLHWRGDEYGAVDPMRLLPRRRNLPPMW